MRITPDFDTVSIVFRGSFNPTIFQPMWLSDNSLIKKSEAEDANIEIIHPQITKFKTEWFDLNVTSDRVQVLSHQEAFFESLRDLAVGMFLILRHSPVKLVGINREFHFKLESEEKWHKVGDLLAPKDMWDELLLRPGLSSLTIQGYRNDSYKGSIFSKIEPSQLLSNGVFVSINDHYEFSSDGASNAEECISLINSQFTSSIANSKNIAYSIIKLGA